MKKLVLALSCLIGSISAAALLPEVKFVRTEHGTLSVATYTPYSWYTRAGASFLARFLPGFNHKTSRYATVSGQEELVSREAALNKAIKTGSADLLRAAFTLTVDRNHRSDAQGLGDQVVRQAVAQAHNALSAQSTVAYKGAAALLSGKAIVAAAGFSGRLNLYNAVRNPVAAAAPEIGAFVPKIDKGGPSEDARHIADTIKAASDYRAPAPAAPLSLKQRVQNAFTPSASTVVSASVALACAYQMAADARQDLEKVYACMLELQKRAEMTGNDGLIVSPEVKAQLTEEIAVVQAALAETHVSKLSRLASFLVAKAGVGAAALVRGSTAAIRGTYNWATGTMESPTVERIGAAVVAGGRATAAQARKVAGVIHGAVNRRRQAQAA